LKGKPVKIRCGPATVTGSFLQSVTGLKPGRRRKAMICKPGDLPVAVNAADPFEGEGRCMSTATRFFSVAFIFE